MIMASVCDNPVKSPAPRCAPGEQSPGGVHVDRTPAIPTAPGEAPPSRPQPRLRCGCCRGTIDDPGVGHKTRCGECGRGLLVPAYVTAKCDRCGCGHKIRPRELATERLCAKCGKLLTVDDILLLPRRRHGRSRSHYRHHQHHTGGHSDAGWVVLVIGVTALIVLASLALL